MVGRVNCTVWQPFRRPEFEFELLSSGRRNTAWIACHLEALVDEGPLATENRSGISFVESEVSLFASVYTHNKFCTIEIFGLG